MKKTPSLSLWIYVSRRSPISDHLAYTILVSFLLSPSHFNHSYIHTYIHLHMKYTCICIIPISMWHITYSQTPTFTFGSLQCFSFSKDPRILYESRKRVYFPCPQSHTHTLRDSGVGWVSACACVCECATIRSFTNCVVAALACFCFVFSFFFWFFLNSVLFCKHTHTHAHTWMEAHTDTLTPWQLRHTHKRTHGVQRERERSLSLSCIGISSSDIVSVKLFCRHFDSHERRERDRNCICVRAKRVCGIGERVYPAILSGPSMRLKISQLRFSYKASWLICMLDKNNFMGTNESL